MTSWLRENRTAILTLVGFLLLWVAGSWADGGAGT